MGLFSSVSSALGLGSGGFSGGSSSSEMKQYPMWNEEQQKLFKKLFGIVDFDKPAPDSPPMSVGRTPEEDSYFSHIEGLAKNEAFQKLLRGEPAYDTSPEASREYFEGTLRPQFMRELNETILPQLRESYAGPGYYGSSRAKATQRAVGTTTDKVNEAFSQLMYQEEQAKRIAMENAMNRVLPAESYYSGELGEAGRLSRMIEQEEVAGNLQKYLMGEEVNGQSSPFYNPSVNLALSLLGFQPYTYGSQTTQQAPGLLYSMLTGAAGGAGTAAGASIFGG